VGEYNITSIRPAIVRWAGGTKDKLADNEANSGGDYGAKC